MSKRKSKVSLNKSISFLKTKRNLQSAVKKSTFLSFHVKTLKKPDEPETQSKMSMHNYKSHFLDQNYKDPNNLFRNPSVPSKHKTSNKASKHIRHSFRNSSADSPKKNLQLYLPRIANDRTLASRTNSESTTKYMRTHYGAQHGQKESQTFVNN